MIDGAVFSDIEGLIRWGVEDAAAQARVIALLRAQAAFAADGDEDGATLLMIAADAANVDVSRLLCEQGADVNHMSATGERPLISLVLGARDDDGHPDRTADRVRIGELLLKAGADPNALGSQGCNALHHAVIHAQPALCECLIRGGADPARRLEDFPSNEDAHELLASPRFRGTAAQRGELSRILRGAHPGRASWD